MKIVSILFLLFSFSVVKADTIDVWHVYYNNKQIGDFNFYGKNKIVLKRAQIQQQDSIKVLYYKDTHCEDCNTFLNVCLLNRKEIVTVNSKGIGNPLSFSANELLKYADEKYFEIIYFDQFNKTNSNKAVIFTIVLE